MYTIHAFKAPSRNVFVCLCCSQFLRLQFWGQFQSSHYNTELLLRYWSMVVLAHLLHSPLLDLTYMAGCRLDWKPDWSPSLLTPFPQRQWNLFNHSLNFLVTTFNLEKLLLPWEAIILTFLKGSGGGAYMFPWTPFCPFWSRYFKINFYFKIVQCSHSVFQLYDFVLCWPTWLPWRSW